QRDDMRLVDGLDGPLGSRVVGAKRLDRVADELQTDRMARAGGIEVHDPAANRKLPRLVGWVLPGVASRRQAVTEVDRRDLVAGAENKADGREARRKAQTRQERCGGR